MDGTGCRHADDVPPRARRVPLPRMSALSVPAPTLGCVPLTRRLGAASVPAGATVAGIGAAVTGLLRDAPRLLTPSGLRGGVTELMWCSAHVAMYPWGLVREEPEPSDRYHLAGLGPVQRGLLAGDVEAAGTPILLLHGMADNRTIFRTLRRRLRRRGFQSVITVNYSQLTNDVRGAARLLAQEIEAVVARTGFERVHVVAHSLGGLIARYYVQRLGGDERVHTLVTLGSPHAGSLHAHLLPVQLCRQLRPGSDLMTELTLDARGCRTRFVAYWSDLDQLIVPHESARLDHPDLTVRNVAVHNVGHLALPRDGRVSHEIATLLSRLDHAGHSVDADVVPLRTDSTA